MRHTSNPRSLVALAAVVVASLTASAGAQDAGAMHAHPAAPAGDSASTTAYRHAAETMHSDMTIDYTGDPDIDFVRGMIPHHQGAVAMAEIELRHGNDPELRKLAQEVVDAQTAEIAFMEAWLAKNGDRVPANH